MNINKISVKGVTILIAFSSPSSNRPSSFDEKSADFLDLCVAYEKIAEDPSKEAKLKESIKSFLNFDSFLDLNVQAEVKPQPLSTEKRIARLLSELNGVEFNGFIRDLMKTEIIVEDIHVRFEDDETHKEKQFAFGASLNVTQCQWSLLIRCIFANDRVFH